jgi:hypothetical protein
MVSTLKTYIGFRMSVDNDGTGAQQTLILQTLQQIALQISNTEKGGGRDKVQQTIKVIHDDVSKNKKGPVSKSIERVTNYYYYNVIVSFILILSIYIKGI